MATIAPRTVAEIATCTNGTDLEQEYTEAVAVLDTAPVLTSLHTLATLAGVAVARVKILEAER